MWSVFQFYAILIWWKCVSQSDCKQMCRIGGRLGSSCASRCGAESEIPAHLCTFTFWAYSTVVVCRSPKPLTEVRILVGPPLTASTRCIIMMHLVLALLGLSFLFLKSSNRENLHLIAHGSFIPIIMLKLCNEKP